MTEAEARTFLGVIEEKAKAAGVRCETFHTIDSSPYRAIIAAAEKHGCDLVFMASHGRRGLSALLLGSETQKVLTHSKIPVLVYREG
jgi:nucleotide-binding universal stress UspA family protein